MLRLVKKEPEGQGPHPPKRRGHPSPALSLTRDETRHLRVAIKNTARAYGGIAVLASVTGLATHSLKAVAYGSVPGSVALARLVARAGGMSVEAVLSGTLGSTGRCPTCGARIGSGAILPSGGGNKPSGGNDAA